MEWGNGSRGELGLGLRWSPPRCNGPQLPSQMLGPCPQVYSQSQPLQASAKTQAGAGLVPRSFSCSVRCHLPCFPTLAAEATNKHSTPAFCLGLLRSKSHHSTEIKTRICSVRADGKAALGISGNSLCLGVPGQPKPPAAWMDRCGMLILTLARALLPPRTLGSGSRRAKGEEILLLMDEGHACSPWLIRSWKPSRTNSAVPRSPRQHRP